MDQIAKDVARWLDYNKPTEEDLPKLAALREAAKGLAIAIVENVPGSADRTVALRKVKDTLMAANAALMAPLQLNKG